MLGNHVIRNARALVLGGAAFGSTAMLERGVDLLERELPVQVLPDGGHYERSPVYHLVVLRDLLEIAAAADVPGLAGAIERMRGFAAGLAPARRRTGALQRRRRSTSRRRSICPRPRTGSPCSPTPATPSSARRASGSRSTAARLLRPTSRRTRTRTRSRSSSGSTAGPSSSIPARSRTSRAPSATGSAARAPIRRSPSTATSSSSGARSVRGRCRASSCSRRPSTELAAAVTGRTGVRHVRRIRLDGSALTIVGPARGGAGAGSSRARCRWRPGTEPEATATGSGSARDASRAPSRSGSSSASTPMRSSCARNGSLPAELGWTIALD